MKNNFLFPLFLLLLLCSGAQAQSATAKGGCTSVTVTGLPSYPTNLFMSPGTFFEPCTDGGSPCCRRLLGGVIGVPRYFLERRNNSGGWTTVMGPQASKVFNIPDALAPIHNTYRVRMNLPELDQCEGGGNISYYDFNSEFMGFAGKYGFNLYTNQVIVGRTTAADNVFTFVDGDGNNSQSDGFDYGEAVKIDASGSKNYDQWWLAVIDAENGATQISGWKFTPAGLIHLNPIWSQAPHEEWQFWAGNEYEVRFVVENSKCQNSDFWNEENDFFHICPAGSGCRFVEGVDPNISISPNPASNLLRLSHFEPSTDLKYELKITDMMGKTIKTVQGWNNEDMDISNLPQGSYILNLMGNGKPLFSDQFMVIR